MRKETIVNNTEAHGWLGLIISALLFVVFFTGSISFFRHEIEQWALQAHYQLEEYEPDGYLSVSEVFEIALAGRAYNPQEPQFVYPPTKAEPYYRAYINVDHSDDIANEDYYLLINPKTGEIMGSMEDFFLADFIYILHYSLNLPLGSYLIGLVTLAFLYIIFSGVLIHAKDMIRGFFRYRSNGRERSQLLDIHNIVGVISLPYTIMLAVTGLIFNLLIIYQIAFALILYQGNTEALLSDAGIVSSSAKWQNIAWQSPPIDELYEQQVDRWGSIPTQVRITGYGDRGATLELFGETGQGLNGRYSISYNLYDRSVNYSDPSGDPNAVTQGISVVTSLHFGNFAGVDLRTIYFLLGLAVCALIVTGNLLWVRQREKTLSSAAVTFVGRFTLASTAGVALACAAAFLAERLLPMGLSDRGGMLVNCFIITLLTATGYVWLVKNRSHALVRLLQCFAALCALIPLIDVVLFRDALKFSVSNGNSTLIGVDVVILGFALLVGYISWRLGKKGDQSKEHQKAEESLTHSNVSPTTL